MEKVALTFSRASLAVVHWECPCLRWPIRRLCTRRSQQRRRLKCPPCILTMTHSTFFVANPLAPSLDLLGILSFRRQRVQLSTLLFVIPCKARRTVSRTRLPLFN